MASVNRSRGLRGAGAIVGVADDVSPTGELERHGRALEAAMVHGALDDAGLELSDVDGVCYAGMATGLAEYLGIQPRYLDGTNVDGSSYELHVEHAAAAIAAGLCDVVVGVYAATPRGDRRRSPAGGHGGAPGREPPPAPVHALGAVAASCTKAACGTTTGPGRREKERRDGRYL